MAGKIVNKSELAAILNITIKTITLWQDEGLPYMKGLQAGGPGAANTYNTAEVIRWWIQRETKGGLDLQAERAKLARAQTETAELRNNLSRGDVVSVEAAIIVAQKAANAIRQKIINSSLTEDEKQKLLIEIYSLRDANFEDAEHEAEKEADEEAEGEKPAA